MSDKQAVVNAASDPFADAQIRQGHPLGRRVQPEQVADAIVFLAGERSDFMTGAVVAVDGGQGLAEAFVAFAAGDVEDSGGQGDVLPAGETGVGGQLLRHVAE